MDNEARAQESQSSRPISLSLRIVDGSGAGLPDGLAVLRASPPSSVLLAQSRSDDTGRVQLPDLPRTNAMLELTAADHYPERVPVQLDQPLDQLRVDLGPVMLDPRSGARLLFSGDVTLARRFVDPEERTARDQLPLDDPSALILASDPAPGARRAVQYVKPFHATADYRVVNLESPVLDDPSTPHTEKAFAFFTLPGALAGLPELGVDYVSLGNNHIYDYLESGLSQTFDHLAALGIPHSGAGFDANSAFLAHHAEVNGQAFALLSMSSVSGVSHEINYVATDIKGGSADLRDNRFVTAAIARERDEGFIPIAQLHTGKEYTRYPSEFALNRIVLAARSGAALVIGHHSHMAQGVGRPEGVLSFYSLGNYIFDTERLETMPGLLARVRMQGEQPVAAQLIPVYIEDFRPRPVAGALADRLLRHMAEFSDDLSVVNLGGIGQLVLDERRPAQVARVLEIELQIDATGEAVVDLRQQKSSRESITAVALLEGAATISLGRDLMLHGDFEDYDVDDDRGEAARWDFSGDSRFVCLSGARSGVRGACLTRLSAHRSDAVLPFRNSIRVMGDAINQPNRDLSLFVSARGQNAGRLRVVARYLASFGGAEFGEDIVLEVPAGSYPWRAFNAAVVIPPDIDPQTNDPSINPRAARVFFRQAPPVAGPGVLHLDEIAMISWEPPPALLASINALDFVRLQGPAGRYRLQLTLTTTRLTVDSRSLSDS